MGNLIKPSDYAKKMGISRQAVYAKIKKGILASKSVDGKLYIVQPQDPMPTSSAPSTPTPSTPARDQAEAPSIDHSPQSIRSSHEFSSLLAAKDETIGVLKETIVDLKETNKMVTSTLRSEVDLLKEAFSEMKMLYSARIEHLQTQETPSVILENDDEVFDDDNLDVDVVFSIDDEGESETSAGDDLAWIELEDFFDEHDVRKQSKQAKVAKRLKKLFKKGDSRVDSFNGQLIVLAGADYGDVFKKGSKKGSKKV
jgi:hypothetical protein